MDFDRIDDTTGEVPAEAPRWFQGEARLQRLPNPFPSVAAVFAVHFRAGARTRPHVHHSGQLLHVVAGRGIIADGTGRREVAVGDVVAVQAGEWHWHGATPHSPMTHVTVQKADDPIEWDVEERDWASGYG